MFDVKDQVVNVVDSVENIAKDYYKLTVANAVDKGSKLGSSLIISAILVALGFFTFLFALFGVCYWLGDKLGHTMYGFFIVSGVLLVLLVALILLKGKVIQPLLRNIIISKIYDERN